VDTDAPLDAEAVIYTGYSLPAVMPLLTVHTVLKLWPGVSCEGRLGVQVVTAAAFR
jgi:hypothetical protein